MAATRDRLLEIYLADHLAGATAGAALARRAARNNAGNETGELLLRLSAEIEEDRQTLGRLVRALGLSRSRPKEAVAAVVEKVGRLKLNGRLRRYSPLSRVLELEALVIGITGKLALWESLQSLPGRDDRLSAFDLERLAERARRQREEVDEHRAAAARTAFGEAPA